MRLVQGEAGSETSYGDPLEAALAWQEQGAEWIHLVDLDAAFGRGSNAALLAEVVGRARRRRSRCAAASATTSRCAPRSPPAARGSTSAPPRSRTPSGARASSPSTATASPSASTCAARRSSARGWTQEGGELYEVLARLDAEGCARYVVTDVASATAR